MTDKTKIFLDGNCIVCDLEIAHYKRIAPAKFDLVDISALDFDAKIYGLKQKDVNLNLHVLTPEGKIEIGLNAFAHIWGQVPKYQWASKLIKFPVINTLANMAYKLFTRIRPWLPKKR